MMNFHIYGVIKLYVFEIGLPFRISLLGGFVARAGEAKVSILRLIHKICVGIKGDYPLKRHPISITDKTTKLMVKRNCRYFLMKTNIFLPHLIAVRIVVNLSSRIIIPEAYLAI